jgi:hypothetical protein
MPFLSSLKAIIAILALTFASAILSASDTLPLAPARRQVIQPVHEYFNLDQTLASAKRGGLVLNGFLNYTHLGSDFGFLGPGQMHCFCETGCICADLSSSPGSWAGVWHSLNRLARENRPLDLRACYPEIIAAPYQPRVVGVQTVVTGSGRLKLEFKSTIEETEGKLPESSSWMQTFPLKGVNGPETFDAVIDPEQIRTAQYLNWVAEPGSDLCVDSISLRVELPPIDFPAYVFLASYAKISRCYSDQTGLVRDRAHITAESFNNVSATGLFALATAAAQQLGMVVDSTAQDTLRRTMKAVASLPRKSGLLPHFVEQRDGKWIPLAASEYSTVDTALCLIALRLAADVLHDDETAAKALEMLRQVNVKDLRDGEGYVIHGLRNDGTPLSSVWRDWGGETALVLMMQRIAAGTTAMPRMNENGRSFRGIGFIAELPALFLPQFNTNARANAGLVDWKAYRMERLAEQKAYFPKYAPDSMVAKLGLFGLSAGEGMNGIGYHVGGVEDPDQRLIFPHYILMSSLLEPDTATAYDLLGKLEAHGWLTPWGLAENIAADGQNYLPMIGSLNASFEAIAAYHLLMKHRRQDDALYQAANADPILQDAIKAVFE